MSGLLLLHTKPFLQLAWRPDPGKAPGVHRTPYPFLDGAGLGLGPGLGIGRLAGSIHLSNVEDLSLVSHLEGAAHLGWGFPLIITEGRHRPPTVPGAGLLLFPYILFIMR